MIETKTVYVTSNGVQWPTMEQAKAEEARLDLALRLDALDPDWAEWDVDDVFALITANFILTSREAQTACHHALIQLHNSMDGLADQEYKECQKSIKLLGQALNIEGY